MEDIQVDRADTGEMHIEPGMPITLDFKIGFKRVKSVVLGYSKDEALIVRLPVCRGTERMTRKGEEVVVRFVWKGVIYGFTTTVIDRHNYGPLQVLFFDFPKEVEKVCLRKTDRISCYFPAELVIKEAVYQGMITDLSVGGVRFIYPFADDSSSIVFSSDDELLVRGYFIGVEDIQQIHCVVRYQVIDDISQTIGLNFTENENPAIKMIEKYVCTIRDNLKAIRVQ